MTDYVPVYIPSKVIGLTASGAVDGGDILVVSGTGTVAKCATAAAMNYIGVAGEPAAANSRVTVYCRGYVHESVAEGAVTAGDQLITSSVAGKQVKTLAPLGGAPGQADVNQARAVIGVALTSVADGAKVRWMEF